MYVTYYEFVEGIAIADIRGFSDRTYKQSGGPITVCINTHSMYFLLYWVASLSRAIRVNYLGK